jgi:8-oxo-dGTP pyrophosphatase MutT (NUDIX family)
MEYGEGPVDCLKREAMEEFGQEIGNIRHFYTTDYYQKALFFDDHQLISIYYLADFCESLRIKLGKKPFDFPELKNGAQSFRWIPLGELEEKDLSFPIDQKVLGLLKKEFL